MEVFLCLIVIISSGSIFACNQVARREDWPTNVVLSAGSETLAMFVPVDDQIHDLESIQCLEEPSHAIGSCNSVSVYQIAVAAGTGSCKFYLSDGSIMTVVGIAGQGFLPVAPPQVVEQAACSIAAAA